MGVLRMTALLFGFSAVGPLIFRNSHMLLESGLTYEVSQLAIRLLRFIQAGRFLEVGTPGVQQLLHCSSLGANFKASHTTAEKWQPGTESTIMIRTKMCIGQTNPKDPKCSVYVGNRNCGFG